jgi:hypothetical protein
MAIGKVNLIIHTTKTDNQVQSPVTADILVSQWNTVAPLWLSLK